MIPPNLIGDTALEEHITFIFIWPAEDGGSIFLQNVDNHLPNDMVSFFRPRYAMFTPVKSLNKETESIVTKVRMFRVGKTKLLSL